MTPSASTISNTPTTAPASDQARSVTVSFQIAADTATTDTPFPVVGDSDGLDLIDDLDAAGASPDELDELGPARVMRSFAFVDLSGFTRYCDNHGDHVALEELGKFRTLVRDTMARRGLRVAKWLGDGAMIVGVDNTALVAATVELIDRWDGRDVPARAGVSAGPVLVFEGDDYLGTTINLAARLCELAEPHQVLADTSATEDLPDWIAATAAGDVEVRSLGTFAVQSLTVS